MLLVRVFEKLFGAFLDMLFNSIQGVEPAFVIFIHPSGLKEVVESDGFGQPFWRVGFPSFGGRG